MWDIHKKFLNHKKKTTKTPQQTLNKFGWGGVKGVDLF